MSTTTPATPNPSQKERLCSIHQDRPLLFACFYTKCTQSFLCRTCYKEHPSEHENEIYELSSVQKIKERFELVEDEKDNIVSQRQDINAQKAQVVLLSKELIITMMDKVASDIQDKKQQLLRDLSEYANTEKDDNTKDLFSRLESDVKTLEDFRLSEDLYENVTQIKILNEEMLPAAKSLIMEVEGVLSTWKLDGSKLDLFEKELSHFIGNHQLMDFLQHVPFKSLTQLDIPDSLKTVHLNLGLAKTDTLSEEVMKLKQDNARLTKELEDSEDSIQAIDQYKLDNIEMKNQVSSLNEENQTLKTQILTLSGQVTNLEKEKTTLENGFNILKEQSKLEEENLRDLSLKVMKGGSCGKFSLGNQSLYYCKGTNNGCNASGTVWGSNPYSSDSDPCRAALHSGVIGVEGGIAYRELEGALSSFTGTKKNGVSTRSYGYYESTHYYLSI